MASKFLRPISEMSLLVASAALSRTHREALAADTEASSHVLRVLGIGFQINLVHLALLACLLASPPVLAAISCSVTLAQAE